MLIVGFQSFIQIIKTKYKCIMFCWFECPQEWAERTNIYIRNEKFTLKEVKIPNAN